MKTNNLYALIVLIHGITKFGFVVAGLYALQKGYIKTGGFLIGAGIVGLIFTRIKIDDPKEEKAKDEQ